MTEAPLFERLLAVPDIPPLIFSWLDPSSLASAAQSHTSATWMPCISTLPPPLGTSLFSSPFSQSVTPKITRGADTKQRTSRPVQTAHAIIFALSARLRRFSFFKNPRRSWWPAVFFDSTTPQPAEK